LANLLPSSRVVSLGFNINPNGGNYQVLFSAHRVARIIKGISPAIINCHYITSYGFIGAIIKLIHKINAKLILSAWGTDILVTPATSKIKFYATRFALKQADYITSDSYYMSDQIEKICGKKPITFPFGLENFPEISYTDKDENLMFSNRSLSSNYNIEQVIRFFKCLKVKKKAIKLIIANDGPERNRLEGLVKDLELEESIRFQGFLDEKEQNEYYRKSLLYISIPQSDSTSVSLLEAMSYGCIPIVSDIPANREWILRNINGFYYGDDMDNIAELIKNKSSIFDMNRNIIRNNAIWQKNVEVFVKEVTQ
jgi:glycosyltransferase involved in cell wall biosynthesis